MTNIHVVIAKNPKIPPTIIPANASDDKPLDKNNNYINLQIW